MKILFSIFLFFVITSISAQEKSCDHLIIVTVDGVRWQEIFTGADSSLLFSNNTIDNNLINQSLYWDSNIEARRKLLMPFTWNFIANHGQLYGNRNYGNKMTVKNKFRFSYSGYNEIFSGYADNLIMGNIPINNKNINVLEFLNNNNSFKDSIAVFTSWNLFPYIFNKNRSKLIINSGYCFPQNDSMITEQEEFEKDIIKIKESTRKDMLTYIAAKEYLQTKKPKIMHIGFGEADEFAHHKLYNNYLSNINMVDKMIADLWLFVQNEETFKNNTILIITTDHGRGNKDKNWDKHGVFIGGSNQTWMAVIGNCINPKGELKNKSITYNAQIAETIANLMGDSFIDNKKYGSSLVSQLK
jgi:hypothetical protein